MKINKVQNDYTMSKYTFWFYMVLASIICSSASLVSYYFYLDSLPWLRLLKYFGKTLI